MSRGSTSTPATGPEKSGSPRLAGVLIAAAVFAVVLLAPTPGGLSDAGQKTAALFILILILWSTEALPIAVTSLLALALQPFLGLVPSVGAAFTNFIGPVFFFVLVMFIIALAWVKTGLAKRFALWMISRAGTDARRVVYVFVIGTGLISMIVSDVPTAAIFMAVALGIFEKLNLKPGQSMFGRAVMLGIPIGALIGGVGTPAGSSINILGLDIIVQQGGDRIGFGQWAAIGVPMVILLLPAAAYLMVRFFPPEIQDIGAIDDVRDELRALGPITPDEWKVIVIQAVMIVLWTLNTFDPRFDVVQIGMLGACAMFLPGIRLFTWKEAQGATGWEILMMAGAVTALGAVSSSSGLAQWLVDSSLGGMEGWSPVWILALISAFTVVIHLMLPIAPVINAVMIPPIMLLGAASGVNPILYALPVIYTASCAFLLPMDAVPLITYSKGYYRMFDMFVPGVIISILWVILMTILLMTVGSLPFLNLI
jgi:solute carrier family 13 (sodium-dependent dicarboxylate transporter), member 2/3/5